MFSLVMFTIVARICFAPADGVHTAEVLPNRIYEEGESYMYICIGDSIPTGDMVSTCLAENEWSLSPPACYGMLDYQNSNQLLC